MLIKIFTRGLVLLLLLAPGIVLAEHIAVKNMRLSTTPQKTRFVFDLSASASYQLQTLSNPERVVLDVHNAVMIGDLSRLRLHQTPVSALRASPQGQALRIVFDLKHPVKPYAFTLKPAGQYGNRLVVDLLTPEATQQKTAATVTKTAPVVHAQPARAQASSAPPVQKTAPVSATTASAPKTHSVKVTMPHPEKLRPIIIVIDPGHGGKDPGATGAGGTREKNVVLAISKTLQAMINREPGFKAVLTRTGDYYIPLRGRLEIARKDKADMFIAIHADAYPDSHAAGASVFALSERGATSEAARWLADSENRSELSNSIDLEDKDRTLRSVLINLAQTNTIAVSLQIGNDILNQLGRFAHLHHHRVEQAAFVVLKSPDIPSLLVETGFLSNPKEERRLISPDYQRKIALAIMLGVKQYFVQHPPMGTMLSGRRSEDQSV